MDWIERIVIDSLSGLDQEAALSDPWGSQTAGLAVLYRLPRSRRHGRKKLQEVKYTFQKELDEYIANGTLGPRQPTWTQMGESSHRDLIRCVSGLSNSRRSQACDYWIIKPRTTSCQLTVRRMPVSESPADKLCRSQGLLLPGFPLDWQQGSC
jgi:hypothetical protein